MRKPLLIVAVLLIPNAVWASLGNVYIAGTAAGSDTGADCANAHAVSFFNTAGNWGAGAAQIGAGTTVHLCAVATFTAGATGLTFQGSGTSGSPITLLFETGAVMQAPFFGGTTLNTCNGPCPAAISIVNQSNLIIDGGTNGIIQNTANGTNLANHQLSTGIQASGSNIIIRNLTIRNIYVNAGSSSTATDTAGQESSDVRINNGATGITVCNNTLTSARVGISSDTSDSSDAVKSNCASNTFTAGVNLFLNTLDDHCWHFATNGTGRAHVYANDLGTFVNWQFPTSTYHTDGIITFGGAGVITTTIYNNYFHGDLGTGSPTGHIFCTYGGASSGSACIIYNNVIVGLGFNATHDTLIYFHGADGHPLGPHQLYNNTLQNGVNSNTLDGDLVTQYTHKNEIYTTGGATGFFWSNNSVSQPCSTITSNNNDFFTGRWNWNGATTSTIAAWRLVCSTDAASVNADPTLDGTFHLLAGSPAIGLGSNLTSLCSGSLTALCFDKPATVGVGGSLTGVARPSSGAWDAGAYQYSTGAPCSPVISSVSLNPTSVVGGNSSTGTVTISCAPSSNSSVLLSSNNTAVATVPASVTVLANQTTATFTVTTLAVCVSTNVTITATLGGSTTASLTVTTGGGQCQGANVIGTAKISGTAVVR